MSRQILCSAEMFLINSRFTGKNVSKIIYNICSFNSVGTLVGKFFEKFNYKNDGSRLIDKGVFYMSIGEMI